ncbi:MAG: Holliday junction resolvase YqgF [Deltaproteobacteria bacterium]|nr:Holliday junction resolvase YqgF [Deltaproteobacteria bacterium]
MRALGLDVGSKTIGIAMTDEANIAAHPLTVLERVGHAGDAAAVLALVNEHAITDVVIGMPFELSGRIGHRARRVQDFATVLRDVIRASQGATGRESTREPVTFHEQDERFTTAEAERVLIGADLSRAKRRRVIDQQAAALILQGWLDTQRSIRRDP